MNDSSYSNANLLRGFELRVAKDSTVQLEMIVKSPVRIFVHTMIVGGVKLCGWKKIGNVPIEKNFDSPTFRTTNDFGTNVKSSNWEIWRAGEPRIKIGKMKERYESLPFGAGHHPIDVVKWLDTGVYPFENPR